MSYNKQKQPQIVLQLKDPQTANCLPIKSSSDSTSCFGLCVAVVASHFLELLQFNAPCNYLTLKSCYLEGLCVGGKNRHDHLLLCVGGQNYQDHLLLFGENVIIYGALLLITEQLIHDRSSRLPPVVLGLRLPM